MAERILLKLCESLGNKVTVDIHQALSQLQGCYHLVPQSQLEDADATSSSHTISLDVGDSPSNCVHKGACSRIPGHPSLSTEEGTQFLTGRQETKCCLQAIPGHVSSEGILLSWVSISSSIKWDDDLAPAAKQMIK